MDVPLFRICRLVLQLYTWKVWKQNKNIISERWQKLNIEKRVITTMLIFSRCVICMVEFVFGDHVRYLPCLHTYHTKCIDDWLMRSFICPSCMEPVDAALLITYESQSWTKNELRLCVHTCAMCGRTCASWKRSTLSDMCVMLNNYTEQRC